MKGRDLEKAIKNANVIFGEIKEKYKDISGYLVFALPPGSSPWGQCEMRTGMTTLLEEKKNKYDQQALRNMINDSAHKQSVINLLKLIADHEKGKKNSNSSGTGGKDDRELEKLKEELSFHHGLLEMRDDILIEIRFDQLDYDLIFRMKKDPLVSQQLTPQTRASIRIVLGTVQEIGQRIISRADWQ